MRPILAAFAAVLLATAAAQAADPAGTMDTPLGKVWTDANGMTLYTFDKDATGATMSACAGDCIVKWPPFLAADGAVAEGEWTLVDVVDQDGATKKMWAYEGKPLYLWINDEKAGDTTGDGVGGVWHAAFAD